MFNVEPEMPEVDEELLEIKPRVKKLANQFNFCERAALTYNNPRRVSILHFNLGSYCNPEYKFLLLSIEKLQK